MLICILFGCTYALGVKSGLCGKQAHNLPIKCSEASFCKRNSAWLWHCGMLVCSTSMLACMICSCVILAAKLCLREKQLQLPCRGRGCPSPPCSAPCVLQLTCTGWHCPYPSDHSLEHILFVLGCEVVNRFAHSRVCLKHGAIGKLCRAQFGSLMRKLA
eukprot:1159765-Pelagomonas_calceolata.AAC.25